MKLKDIIITCLQNLFRRKARTFLTVLGVVIGTCAIMIMVSIGVGMKESQEKMLSEMGDLTIITVYPASKSKNSAKLNTETVDQIRRFPNVSIVTPKLTPDNVRFKISAGQNDRFISDYTTLVGLEPKAIPSLGFKLLEGQALSSREGDVLIGQNFAFMFMDTKRPEGQNMVDTSALYMGPNSGLPMPVPYFDVNKTPLQMVFEYGDKKQVRYKLKVVGRMKEDMSKGSETSDGIIMDIATLQKWITNVKRLSNERRDPRQGYGSVLVKVKNIQSVAQIEQDIRSMGFNTSSMESLRKPMEDETRQKQMILGGLGAISLIVAALGITNTMIMSISERTREIGVMKALGCYVKDIRSIFLMEAGTIGLIGGIVGILISFVFSVVMNLLQAKVPPANFQDILNILNAKGSRTSVIPLWLVGFSLVFSVFIGLGSGYYPANKAVKISALEAIKHD